MQRVFVLSSEKQPLTPCRPARARLLLSTRQAAVFRRYPFTIIMRRPTVEDPVVEPCRVKIDPGSKTTGIALVDETRNRVVFAVEVQHRGQAVHKAMQQRAAQRRRRRCANLRHRKPRFDNRRRREGWLPPSLGSRVANVATWVARFRRYAPVAALSLELVKFDTQVMANPEIDGVEYQQGELAGYEVREYLLEKWGRKCAYCGAQGVPLQVEHITPKARGGSNRVSNLSIACNRCNQEKGERTAAEYGHPEVQANAKLPLRDAAAVNTIRWALYRRLQSTGLPVECGTGGRTKYNRTRQGYPKAHWTDAACVGESGGNVRLDPVQQALVIKACGHGNRQTCATDRYGFPKRHRQRQRRYFGFQTGDLVRAVVPSGKRQGTHVGRVAVRARGSFNVGTATDISWKHCRLTQRSDGYSYSKGGAHSPVAFRRRPPAPITVVQECGKPTLVRVDGDLDIGSSSVLKETLLNLIHAGEHQLVVDLGKAAYIDSAGLGVLTGAFLRLAALDGSFRVRNPDVEALDLLEAARLVELLGVFYEDDPDGL